MEIRFAIYLMYSLPWRAAALIKSEGWNWERALPQFAFGNSISLLITDRSPMCTHMTTNPRALMLFCNLINEAKFHFHYSVPIPIMMIFRLVSKLDFVYITHHKSLI
jgi:hypothetical protein